MLDGIATKADENFIKIEERLNKIESRLNALTNETSNNFTDVGDQLGVFKAAVDGQFGSIKAEIIKKSAATRYGQYHIDQKKFNIEN